MGLADKNSRCAHDPGRSQVEPDGDAWGCCKSPDSPGSEASSMVSYPLLTELGGRAPVGSAAAQRRPRRGMQAAEWPGSRPQAAGRRSAGFSQDLGA